MRKFTLTALLLLSSAQAEPANAAESAALLPAVEAAARGTRAWVDDDNYKVAYENFDQCVKIVTKAVADFPGILTKYPPSGRYSSVERLLKVCTDDRRTMLVKLNPQLSKDLNEMSTIGGKYLNSLTNSMMSDPVERLDFLNQCVQVTEKFIKTHPTMKDERFEFGTEFSTATALSAKCKEDRVRTQKAAATQADAATKAMVVKLAPLEKQVDAAWKKYQAAKIKPERTNPEILLKYRDMNAARQSLTDLGSQFNTLVGEANRIGPVGLNAIRPLVIKYVNMADTSELDMKAMETKADKAFAQQDAQVKATMPKLISGQRLAIFNSRGIPANWSGGPTFSKNGIYSGDGVAIAKDIASATQWYYRENSQGCDYKYFFNKNAVVSVEKPLGCP